METKTRRFSEFTNEEVYMLLRQAIEACPAITNSELTYYVWYSLEEKMTYRSLLLEIQEEKRIRDLIKLTDEEEVEAEEV